MNFNEIEKLLFLKGYTFVKKYTENGSTIMIYVYRNSRDDYHVVTNGTKVYHVLKSVPKKTVEIYDI